MNEILKLANGPVMWAFSLITIGVAVLQSILIFRQTQKYNEKTNMLTKKEVKASLKAGGIVAIGPAVSVFVVALSMITLIGAPITLMRIGMIGSAGSELSAASIGAQMAGVTLGSEELTGKALAAALWSMALMSCGYLVLVPMIARGLGSTFDKMLQKNSDGKTSVGVYICSAILPFVIFAALSYFQAKESVAHLIALIVGGVLMVATNVLATKMDKQWLKQWAMGISVLGAIISGGIVNSLF
ncbi:DUF5058 family protein [Roseburia hominis]